MAITITLTAGDSAQDMGVGYTVWGASYSNLGSQWAWIGGNRFAAPGSRGTFYIDGEDRVHVEWKAPPNTAQPPAASSQFVTVTFTPLPLWDSGTASAPKGLYYDRNPTSATLQNSSGGIAPHALTIRATYTVPAARKAYVEIGQVIAILEAAGDLAAGSAQTFIQFTPSGGVGVSLATAYIQGTAPLRTYAASLFAASLWLGAGDKLQIATANIYTATKMTFLGSSKLTEFDA